VCLIQARKKLNVSEKNFLREEKLRVAVENYKYYEDIEFLEVIGSLFDWEFE
jgi:hypothetical protein